LKTGQTQIDILTNSNVILLNSGFLKKIMEAVKTVVSVFTLLAHLFSVHSARCVICLVTSTNGIGMWTVEVSRSEYSAPSARHIGLVTLLHLLAPKFQTNIIILIY
jgi:hypothetical protein